MQTQRPQGRDLILEMDQTVLPNGSVALWYLGQSGFVAKGGGRVAYFDPYLSDFLEQFTVGRPDADPRHFRPPLGPSDVCNADLFFGSHYHYDHIDPTVVRAVARCSPACRFIVPGAALETLEAFGLPPDRVVTPAVDQLQTSAGVSFVSIPAAHEAFDYDPVHGYPYRGYVVTLGGVTIYHAGDCVPYDGLVERLAALDVDIALLPINGRDYFRLGRGFTGNFSYREAAELASAAGIRLLIPMHFGMHLANTERPGYLVDYLVDHFPAQRFHIMVPGERCVYFKSASGILAFTS